MRPTQTERPTTRSTRARRRSVPAIVLLLAMLLGACAAGDDAGSATAPDQGGDEGAATEAPEDGEGDSAGGASGGSGDGEVVNIGIPLGRKVIRTAELELAVRDTAAAVEQAGAIAERSGGFVATADLVREPGGQLVGDLTLRVPTGRLDATLSSLEALATEVRSKRIGSDDVTEEYSDIEAQLRNLRALEAELLDLLAEIRGQSDSAEEILRVFERIRQVRQEIEQLQGRQQVLDDLVDLATIELELTPSSEALPLADEGWSPGGVARDALRTTVGALQGLADVAIWIALTALPILLVLAAPVALALYATRRWRHRPVRSSD